MSCCPDPHVKDACAECEVPQMARNNYFDGKLIVARDLTDEQRYFIGKDRRHNQQLHGWGVVCGLRVKPHPNPACRAQYVVIEPGTALDCCGREIRVPREEFFDFRAAFTAWWKQQHGDEAPVDDQPRELQICVRYRECATENVPALFDACGCDDTACQPNRILEGYQFDLVVEPARPPADPGSLTLTWRTTKDIVHAHRVAVDRQNQHWFALSNDDPATLYSFDTSNDSPLAAPLALPAGQPADLAVLADGANVCVAFRPAATPANLEVLVLDAANPTLPALNTLSHAQATGDLLLAAAPANRLFGLVRDGANSTLLVWDDVLSANPPDTVALTEAATHFAVSPDGLWIFVALTAAQIAIFDATDLAAVPLIVPLPAGASPSLLAVAQSPAAFRLFVADATTRAIQVFDATPGTAPHLTPKGNPVSLAPAEPVDLVSSAGGRWLIAHVRDAAGAGSLQVIDAQQAELNQPALGPVLPIGDQPAGLAPAPDGTRLYAAFNGPTASPGGGGVAIVEVTEARCADILRESLDGCPHCDTANCVVLATLTDYVFNQPVEDTHLDNWRDRKILPSTETLTRLIRCLLAKGTGGGQPGEQGPIGPIGPAGPGIDQVVATAGPPVPNGTALPATITGAPPNRTLNLTVPRGNDGTNGSPSVLAVDLQMVPCSDPPVGQIQNLPAPTLVLRIPSLCQELTRICSINWRHGRRTAQADLGRRLVVAFDRNLRFLNNPLLPEHLFLVLRSQFDDNTNRICWCEVPGETRLARLAERCNARSDLSDADPANPPNAVFFQGDLRPDATYRVVLKCDFLADERPPNERGRAPDGNHLPPWFGSPNYRTGDGVEGGTFESWFELSQ
jgi:DNA-binding beta-propeller fold protein YncE